MYPRGSQTESTALECISFDEERRQFVTKIGKWNVRIHFRYRESDSLNNLV